jgi:hypothetical protein
MDLRSFVRKGLQYYFMYAESVNGIMGLRNVEDYFSLSLSFIIVFSDTSLHREHS